MAGLPEIVDRLAQIIVGVPDLEAEVVHADPPPQRAQSGPADDEEAGDGEKAGG